MRSIIVSLSTGYIFFYFSELVFWSRPKPEDNLINWFQTWMAYSIMAFLFLTVIQKFKVRNLPSLFLAGAFFGWLAEGIIVQTTYEDLPLSISFTGLAWHSLITVVLGWYGLQVSLGRSLRATTIYSVLMGIFIWFWGVTWIYEEPATMATPAVFGIYHILSGILLIISLFISNSLYLHPFNPSKWAIRIISGIFFILYTYILISGMITALILIPLMAAIFISLKRNSSHEHQDSLLAGLSMKIPHIHYLAILLVPLISTILYAVYFNLGLKLPTNWVVYLITTPAGFILFGWSIFQVWKRPAVA